MNLKEFPTPLPWEGFRTTVSGQSKPAIFWNRKQPLRTTWLAARAGAAPGFSLTLIYLRTLGTDEELGNYRSRGGSVLDLQSSEDGFQMGFDSFGRHP
jgi:hypothetical protein